MFGIGFVILCAAMLLFCFIRPDKHPEHWAASLLFAMYLASGVMMMASLSIWLYHVMP